jgi:hypothetical protein
MNRFRRAVRVLPSFPNTGIRLLALTAITICLHSVVGCHYFCDPLGGEKRLPAPLAEKLPAKVEGEIYRVWTVNELQINYDIYRCYLILQGVAAIDGDENSTQAAVQFVTDAIGKNQLLATVAGYDHLKRSISQVQVNDKNLNLEIIRNGWGRYDGTRFEHSEDFARAEQVARENKLGLWQPKKF